MTSLKNSVNDEYKEFLLKHREAQSKFNYFLLGISLAFITITFQTYQRGLDISFDYLLLLSWVIMLICSFSGIFRLRHVYSLLGIEAEYLRYISQLQRDEEKENILKKVIDKKQNLLTIYGDIQISFFFIALIIFLLFQITKMYPSIFGILKWEP